MAEAEKGAQVSAVGRVALARWAPLAAVAAVTAAGVVAYLASPAHDLHDPYHGLQQLDMLYLDEPASGLDRLGVEPGRPAVLVFCPGACPLPQLSNAQVVRSTAAELAQQYALRTAAGRVGPRVRAGRRFRLAALPHLRPGAGAARA